MSKPNRLKFSLMRRSFCSVKSKAITERSGKISFKKALLPPGAAHKSKANPDSMVFANTMGGKAAASF